MWTGFYCFDREEDPAYDWWEKLSNLLHTTGCGKTIHPEVLVVV